MGVCIPSSSNKSASLTALIKEEDLTDLQKSLKTQLILFHQKLLKTQKKVENYIQENENSLALLSIYREMCLIRTNDSIREVLTVTDPLYKEKIGKKEFDEYVKEGNLILKEANSKIFTDEYESVVGDRLSVKEYLQKECKVDAQFYKQLEDKIEDKKKLYSEYNTVGTIRTRYIRSQKINLT